MCFRHGTIVALDARRALGPITANFVGFGPGCSWGET
jgi:hypothetical protein